MGNLIPAKSSVVVVVAIEMSIDNYPGGLGIRIVAVKIIIVQQ